MYYKYKWYICTLFFYTLTCIYQSIHRRLLVCDPKIRFPFPYCPSNIKSPSSLLLTEIRWQERERTVKCRQEDAEEINTHTLSLSLQRTLLSVHGRRKTSMYCRQLSAHTTVLLKSTVLKHPTWSDNPYRLLCLLISLNMIHNHIYINVLHTEHLLSQRWGGRIPLK